MGSWKSHESSLPAMAGHRHGTGVSKVSVPRGCTVIAEVRCCMDVDGEKLEHVVLALLPMNSFKEEDERRRTNERTTSLSRAGKKACTRQTVRSPAWVGERQCPGELRD